MFKDMPMEITWAEAKKIFDTNIAIRGGGGGVLSYGGKWYDVRHMSAADIADFLASATRGVKH